MQQPAAAQQVGWARLVLLQQMQMQILWVGRSSEFTWCSMAVQVQLCKCQSIRPGE